MLWTPEQANSAELETVGISKSPTTVVTANGEMLTKEEATVYVRQLDLMLLEDTPAVLSLGKVYEDHGKNYHWNSGRNHISSKKGRKINCSTTNYVPFGVPGSPTSFSTSSSPTSPASSSQESVIFTEQPASTRSEKMGEEVQGNLSHDLAEWLQEFRHGLVDESVPEHRDASSSSHELPSESRAKTEPGSGEHSVFSHFPEDPNSDICLRTKITRASCRRRTGTVVPRVEN